MEEREGEEKGYEERKLSHFHLILKISVNTCNVHL